MSQKEQTSESLVNTSLQSVSHLRKEMIETMQAVSDIADRGSNRLLLALGGGLLVLSFVFKLVSSLLGRFGAEGGLSAAEFITVIIVSMILLLAGSAMRIYQFNKEQEAGKRVRESGVELISKAMDTGVSLAEPKPTKDINL